jgi:hypothetical protein
MTEQALVQAQPAPEPRAVAVVTPMQMLQVAMERGADLDRLQQLMDLQQRWEANEARKAYVAAMAAFKANPPEILKGKHVKFTTARGTTEYDHATLADVCGAATKGLADVGISHRWDITQEGGKVTVTCAMTHSLGHSERVAMTATADDSGGKNAIQAIGSTVTYLQRYTLLAATGLAARDMDDDGRGAEPAETISAHQVADLEALIEDVGANKAAFLKYLKVDSLDQIHAKAYRTAVAALENKRRQA